MNTVKLILLACPAVLALTLLVPAHATELAVEPTDTTKTVDASTPPIFEVVFEQETPEPMLEITEAESNAAINSYGCDCSGCVNAVRQIQGKLPLL